MNNEQENNVSIEDVLYFINDYISRNRGTVIVESDCISKNSNLDSFGMMELFLELDEEYGCFDFNDLDKKENNFDYGIQTPTTIHERILSCI